MSAVRESNGIFDWGYKAASSGIRKGIALVIGADPTKAVKATAARQGKYRGIAMDAGTAPDGTANYGAAATTPAEPINAQKLGLASALVPAAQQVTAGDQAVTDANGMFVPRTPFSVSAFVFGQFDETKLIGSVAAFAALELLPHYIETVRPILAGCAGAITGATKYLGDVSQAKAAAQVPRYVCRFTGETIRNLAASLITAPGGADTVVFTVQKSSDNGATWTDTALTCTISAAGKAASDLTHSASLTAGDLLAVKAVSSAGTAADATVTFDVT